MIAYMKEYLAEVDPDVKLRFKAACVGMAGLVLVMVAAAVAIVQK